MGDLLRFLLDSIQYLWPFRIVEQFERGVYHVCGRRVAVPARLGGPDCRPGIPWPIIPFFTDVKIIAIKRTTLVIPKQTIDCLDGQTLTFSASAQVEIEDANLAYNEVDQWAETSTEDVASVLSDKLMRMDAAKFAPEERSKMIGECRRAITGLLATYGVRLVSLRFNNFTRKGIVVQLFNEQSFPKA